MSTRHAQKQEVAQLQEVNVKDSSEPLSGLQTNSDLQVNDALTQNKIESNKKLNGEDQV